MQRLFVGWIQMMKRFLLMALFVCLVSACSVNLQEVELEPLLIQPGDLPAGLSGAQVKDEAPEMFSGVPEPVRAVNQLFQRDGENAGGVAVLLYESKDDLNKAYEITLDGMVEDLEQQVDLGEKSAVSSETIDIFGAYLGFAEAAFQRCNALVHVRLTKQNAVEVLAEIPQSEIVSYGKRLDSRLQEAICR